MTAAKATPAHTPGPFKNAPWTVGERDEKTNLVRIAGADGITVANAKGHSAHHIAAAPETAAERDALRAEVERLKMALRGMIDGCSNAPMPADSFDMIPIAQARAALGGQA